jgi:asparagine synthase (glutamine-hydrolysing)
MCGIAGFVDKRKRFSEAEKRKLVSGMLSAIKHRGPDGDGISIEKNVAVAQARLSIVDLSPAGLQPMWDDAKQIAISVNGELYNHPSLRPWLEKKYHFRSHSDSETLLYAYAEWGTACLARCKGMYAFSILDVPRNRLFLAVDRFSIKPLYYVDSDDWFAWSSEVKALLRLPGVKRELNESALGEHLMFRSIAGTATLFKGIEKALPAQMFVFDIGTNRLEKSTYWQPASGGETSVDDVRAALEKSVKEHMLSDVPIGVQLSGGLDSSMVSVLVRREMPNDDLHSYAVGLADPAWNEFPYSREVARILPTKHHEMLFTEEEFCTALPVATYHYDEPINHSHSVPMMLLAAEAKKHVTVLMSGEGADEIFGGYTRYRKLLAVSLSDTSLLNSNAFVSEETIRAVAPRLNISIEHRKDLIEESRDKPDHIRLAEYDLATYLTPLLLRQDKMGMRSGLENRVPFLDHELVELALRLPQNERIRNGETKVALKRIASDMLPEHIVHRNKVGFSQPLESWFRNKSGLGAYLPLLYAMDRGIFDRAIVSEYMDAHVRGAANHAELLWVLLNLELWVKIFVDDVDPKMVAEEWKAVAQHTTP